MASEAMNDEGSFQYRNFHGRTMKVTLCDADQEFTSKVARIQDDIISRTGGPLVAGINGTNTLNGNSEETPSPVEEVPQMPPEVVDASPLPDSVLSAGLNIDINEVDESARGSMEMQEETFEPVIPGSPIGTSDESSAVDPEACQYQTHANNPTKENDAPEIAANKNSTLPFLSPEAMAPIIEDDGLETIPRVDQPSVEHSPDHGTRLSVFNRVDLIQYSEYEWKGTTPKAALMRHGYQQVISETAHTCMRKIRGDNYCALRATCFQILSQKLDVLKTWENKFDEVINIPQTLLQSHRCSWLTQWSFAERLKVTPKKRIDTLKSCLENFCDKVQISKNIELDEDRIGHFSSYFNSGKPDEVLLFEAMKLLMLHSAVLLHERMSKEEEVPVFAWLLFARDTSENPEQLMLNHLNSAGNTGGLEQVEMFLLGYALNITIRVLRPSQVGEEDFITHYPDNHLNDWDTCNLIAEDDRHYNIVVP